MKEARSSNLFKGVRLDSTGEEVSILQFADDAIFVGEWTMDNAMNLMRILKSRILKCFELCSGLRINLSKSSLMGVSVPKEEVQKVARWLNCKEGSIPFTYLGLPVGDNMAKASAWQPIIDKFKSRLSLWKAKHLSAGGRLCLIKSVLGGLGNYFFSLYKAPNKVLSSLESIRRRFFWGEVNQSRKINWVAWNKALRDKKSGGLGIGSLKALNLAMLSKWHWREKVEPNAKWKHVISAISESINGSRIGVWKSIQRIGRELEAWGINLQNLIIPNEDNRGWSWQLDDNGEFSVRSLRKFIDCLILPSADSETIWVKGVTSKANVHLWRVMNNRLPTMDNLIKRGVLVNSDGCKFCISNQESADHVFAACSTTKTVSAYLSNWVNWWPTSARSISDLWESIDSGSSGSLDRMIRRTIGAAFFWVLWNQRNNKTFSGAVKKEREIAEDIKFLAYDWIRGRVKAGLPVGGNMNRASNWKPLIDKFKSKLSTWKAKTLSIGGRLCLCKSVLGSLGIYLFSLYKAHMKVINILESHRCRFFWGGTDNQKKICWMAWENVIRDKSCGGLGIGSLCSLNMALLAKWRWRERTETDAIWLKVVQHCNLETDNHNRRIKGVWDRIYAVEKELRDLGINLDTLMHLEDDGSRWVWELEANQTFTVRSLRKMIDVISLPLSNQDTEWSKWIPSKVNIFLWRVLNKRLATRDNLQKRGVTITTDLCPLCMSTSENMDHVMVSCSTTKIASAILSNWINWWPVNEINIEDWWRKVQRSGADKTQKQVSWVIGAAFLWSIWEQRNRKAFNGEFKNEQAICRDVQFLSFDWIRSRAKGYNLHPGYKFLPSDSDLIVHYLKPKIATGTHPPCRLHEVYLYDHHPQQLSETYRAASENKWYFLTPRVRIYPKGSRPKRSTKEFGRWKQTQKCTPVYDDVNTQMVVGKRASLAFHDDKDHKTEWLIHETPTPSTVTTIVPNGTPPQQWLTQNAFTSPYSAVVILHDALHLFFLQPPALRRPTLPAGGGYLRSSNPLLRALGSDTNCWN
ncbi:hypothetical protein OSB04_030828 [Centaurea solstitialis]|uniref:NAC domain-containing protein n=1 Tax=Centaurea solstitialis TaxID=347529 RepID=A0AA38S8D6_9ASTR|nr:hypothetical protein OSB04_030828 [Centaurea solstitialis]